MHTACGWVAEPAGGVGSSRGSTLAVQGGRSLVAEGKADASARGAGRLVSHASAPLPTLQDLRHQ